ncbi:MAG: ABC-2 transporter permease [Clostridiaceae bacterium]|nr:ABC-2 transporter permease [Clostridiaceae bacterium]
MASAAKFVSSFVKHTAAEPETYPSILLVACVAAVILALNMPIMFRFGVERGRIAFFIAIAVAAVAAAAVGIEAMSALSAFKVDLITVLLLSVIATLVISIISVLLSFRFYQRRMVS